MNEPDIIRADKLSFWYKNPHVQALEDISFAIAEGDFVALLGPNGSGKSTLLKLILGLLKPTSGQITVKGISGCSESAKIQRMMGYVPQRENVNSRIPLTVFDVVKQGIILRLAGVVSPAEINKRIDEAVSQVGLSELKNRLYSALSGGEQQKTLIARALAVNPRILILDEPFAAVDVSSQQQIAELLKRLSVDDKVTVIAAVHNVNILAHELDSVMLLNRKLISFGSPESVLTTETLKAAYGTDIPVLICDDGYRHPIMEASHDRDR